MDEREARVEAQLDALGRRVHELEQRLAALEARPAASNAARPFPAAAGSEPEPRHPLFPAAADATTVLAVLGRTLLVLAGAFFLRALTDSGTFVPPLGVALGMAYALVWLVAADRAAARRRLLGTTFHAVSFAMISLPLVVEATARFKIFSTTTSAAALAVLAALGLAVAIRRRLEGLAWITALGVVMAALVLCIITTRLAPYVTVLVLLGGATLWMAYVLDWFYLRWPVAIATNLSLLVLGGRSLGHSGGDTPAAALAVQILLLATYLGSVATRTLFLDRDVVPFEVAQSIAAIIIGLGGAAYVTRASGIGGAVLGVASLVLGVGCYAVAVAFVARRAGRQKNFYFYTSAALVLAMTGAGLLLPPRSLALALTAFALLAAWAGRKSGRGTFRVHGASYLVAAAIASGLVLHEAHGLGLPVAPAHDLALVRLVVLAACVLGVFMLAPSATWQPAGRLARVPRLLLLVLAVTGIAGVASDALTPALTGALGATAAAGAMATVRTALLVLATLGLAWAGGARGFVEGAWLVYPLLIATGIKFVAHDLRASRPATLFVAFALYGAALILAPRLRKRAGRRADAPVP